jgi:hypothetical protein
LLRRSAIANCGADHRQCEKNITFSEPKNNRANGLSNCGATALLQEMIDSSGELG